jgi:hypothetical protein
MANLLRERWSKLNWEQKAGITALSVCCLFLFFGGISQLRSYVRKPFLVSHRNLADAIRIRTQTYQNDEKQARELQLKDTDRDGISDYDEQYVYRTSPYLPDSDSDGLSDSEEIAAGEDPNCPQGKNCLDIQTAVPETPTSTLELGAGTSLAGIQAAVSAQQSGVDTFIANPKPPDSMTAAETREYIRAHQLLPADQLAELPDEAIMQAYRLSYQDALRIQAAHAAVGGSPPTPSPQPTP